MSSNKAQRGVVDKKKQTKKGAPTDEEIEFKKKQQADAKALKEAAAGMKKKK
jgi:hypothetical protein